MVPDERPGDLPRGLTSDKQDGVVNLTPEDLETNLTKSEELQLVDIYKGLGHVGEGHCRAEEI